MKKIKVDCCANCKYLLAIGDPIQYAECKEHLSKKLERLVIKDIRSIPKECPLEDY